MLRQTSKTRLIDLRGLFLLSALCLVMLAQRKVTIITWFVLGLFSLYCIFKWRQAILLVFLWSFVEGFLRLWTGGHIIVFFFKDIMFTAIYISFLLEKFFLRENILFRHPVNLPLLWLLVLSIVQLINPGLLSILVGLVGLKTIFFYAPLFYIAYKFFESKDSIYQFCFMLIMAAIPICAYAVIQFLQGPSVYRGMGEAFVPWVITYGAAGVVFNPPSTFIFIGVFGSYLLFMAILGISMLNLKIKTFHKAICWCSFMFILAAMVVTTRRLTWAILAAEFPIMFLLQKKTKHVITLITAPVLIIIIAINLIPGTYDLFFGRTFQMFANPGRIIFQERVGGILHWHIPTMVSSALIGKGTGMGSLGRRYVLTGDVYQVPMECQYAKIWFELSVWGFIIFIWMLLRLLKPSWNIYRRMGEPNMKWIALSIFMYQVGVVIAGAITNILDLPVNAIFFWFFSGLLAKMPLCTIKES